MIYLLDSNILIQSRRMYPMDVWESFWACLKTLALENKIFTSIKVKEEIDKGCDELPEWIKCNLPKDFCLPIDQDVVQAYTEVQNWAVNENRYTQAALADFAIVADAYLVATAKAKSMKVVTFEKSNPIAKKRVLIPDVCEGLHVPCCELNDMLRDLGIKL